MKYDIPSENTIAMIVVNVINNEPVYIHIQNKTNILPTPINHVSFNRHSSNTVFFRPVK